MGLGGWKIAYRGKSFNGKRELRRGKRDPAGLTLRCLKLARKVRLTTNHSCIPLRFFFLGFNHSICKGFFSVGMCRTSIERLAININCSDNGQRNIIINFVRQLANLSYLDDRVA